MTKEMFKNFKYVWNRYLVRTTVYTIPQDTKINTYFNNVELLCLFKYVIFILYFNRFLLRKQNTKIS